MHQDSFNEYVSSTLTELGIENKIVWQPDDPRLSHYHIVVKVRDDNLIFHTFAYDVWENIESFWCYFDKSRQKFFKTEFEKYYDTKRFHSSSRIGHSTVKPGFADVENEIKETTKEHIVQTLKQLKLIE